ncbi:MAG TPA: hypothetical protein P5161_04465 [Eubacteriales bacterium]|jgi:hypothetical protein|nr:hypothetical protein [Eubacteriales bacterium]HRU84809.1 hypothetical protein [Eubacteriales bacterium]
MKYENIKVADSVTTENVFVENRIGEKPEKKRHTFDSLDMAILPAAIGVLASLGYLIYNIVRTVSLNAAANALNSLLGAII